MPTPAQISRAIAAIERPYPADDLIKTYKDFLKVRVVLPYYQYNPKVLVSLVDMAYDLWHSKERINRISLLTVIKQYGSRVKAVKSYYNQSKAELHPFPLGTNRKICWLFQRCFDIELPINRKQAESIKIICNSLLIDAPLGPEEEQWLCDNVHKSLMILNRLLRYPVASPVISQWARTHYQHDNYRERRAEIAGWVLDENPDFVIDEQTLIEDVGYLNKKDKTALLQYDEEVNAKKIMDKELSSLLGANGNTLPDLFGFGAPPADYNSAPPKLELTKRFYPVPVDNDAYQKYYVKVPDFDLLIHEFHKNISHIKSTTMLWAIAYSRLELAKKEILLKRYFQESSANSFFYICQRLQSVHLLQWLRKNQNK